MTDPAAVTELVAAVRDQAAEIVDLDAARAEAWASDVLAWAAELDDDPAALLGSALDPTADALALAAVAALVAPAAPEPVPGVDWAPWLGTSRVEGAWVLEGRGGTSVALRFVDGGDARHVVTVDLVPGPPETVGEVVVGPGDLLDAIEEDDARVDATDADPVEVAARVSLALRRTPRPRESAVVNGHLLVARLASITRERVAAPKAVEEAIPEPPVRDPEDDAYARAVLHRALDVAVDADPRAVVAIAARVAPTDLGPLTPAERDAVVILEWADWLGAVIGLVREGTGAPVAGEHLVDLVNRTPEVTSTIPKSDRARIAWAFDTLTAGWADLGLVSEGGLTGAGVRVLPAALAAAWSGPGE